MAKILLTTASLERAGELREAFEPDDRVEFVTGPEDARSALADVEDDDAALILTGSPRDPAAHSLVAAVSENGKRIPVVAVLGEEEMVPAGRPDEFGLDEFFVEPIDVDEVVLVVRRLIDRMHLQEELGIVGNTEAVHEVVERVAQIAPVGSTVLITGESGTGKELVARGLHRLSPRRGKPFIPVNIPALPETLLESELFGHEKGAFTGAASLRKGMFELADGGTIFLDEVAEMPSGPQTKLLRVLEEREFMRVGGSSPIRVDVRVIAATNRNLRQAVAMNEFRRDLYYRLDVLRIHMPPLRERRADIPLLVHHFIRVFSQEHRREFKGITREAMEILVRYDWPGNVRELQNLIESMVVLAPGSVIRPEDIPPEVGQDTGTALLPQATESAAPSRREEAPAGQQLPEMEFIFRTLVELKLDMEDLRREFERYKREHPELVERRHGSVISLPGEDHEEERRRPRGVDLTPRVKEPAEGGAVEEQRETEERREAEASISFTPGMSMQELERAAIVATLESVDGNRRQAAEKLGIGERTLYRKLKEYEIDA